jgi:UDP-hydrolysing UDP-N-acetyl-D-glucosamine 2-epimerase
LAEVRRLAVLTTGRHDYGILRSTFRVLAEAADFDLRVWAGGMHLQPRFGVPLELLRADGIAPARELPFVAEPPAPPDDAARALSQVGQALAADRPDALLLVGDRAEILAAGLAATLAAVPIVHLHGGEESEGAIDNACRHALTKLSHLHLVSHPAHAARVVQMGEDPAVVVVVGAPGLDNAFRDDLPSRAELERDLGVSLASPVVLVTMHPATLGADAEDEVAAVSAAMAAVDAQYVVTLPNADHGGAAIAGHWQRWARGRDNVSVLAALGERRYFGMLRLAVAVLGNSSSGIIEAPMLGVPVVNVGDRQAGRLRFGPVADVPPDPTAIATALRVALDKGRGPGSQQPQQGPAAPRIVEAVRRWSIPCPPRKRFREPG